MAIRVRTAAVWVPPIQGQYSSGDRIRDLPGQESTLGQETPDQKLLHGGPWQGHMDCWTKQVLEWLLISQKQPGTTQPQILF
ncbi:PREDICTED: zinc finger protein 268 isoform X2 [Condylura cristata]|uniref:zinc finger protein 268 isoform X2 n=1 Tax=Condylura cristata TaxID=143302 RepID=UPI00064346F2|nr:PREDICTED: zinc finger protein 268 isoform X2 [Condylura cristata]